MAKMQKDIDYIKSEQSESKTDIKTILAKLDGMDAKYARRSEFEDMKREFNWVKATSISALLSIVAFLTKTLFL